MLMVVDSATVSASSLTVHVSLGEPAAIDVVWPSELAVSEQLPMLPTAPPLLVAVSTALPGTWSSV